MKKFFILLAAIAGFTLNASAQTTPAQAPTTANAAEFKFVEEKHDFGKVPQGKPVTNVFEFTNVGSAPLILSAVQPTCGCTIADFTKTPVLPGGKGSITITYNAAMVSAFNKTIVVTSNTKTPTKYLIITGEVVAPAAGAAASTGAAAAKAPTGR